MRTARGDALNNLANAVSDAINAALTGGMDPDTTCSVAAKVIADYWLHYYDGPPPFTAVFADAAIEAGKPGAISPELATAILNANIGKPGPWDFDKRGAAVVTQAWHAIAAATPADPDRWSDLARQFRKPQFMTTTSGPGSRPGARRYSVEFTFVGDDGPEAEAACKRRDDLHAAIVKAARATS